MKGVKNHMEYTMIDQSLVDRRIDRIARLSQGAELLKAKVSNISKLFEQETMDDVEETLRQQAYFEEESIHEPIVAIEPEPEFVQDLSSEPVIHEPQVNNVQPTYVAEINNTKIPEKDEVSMISDGDLDDILNSISFDDMDLGL